MPTKTRAPLYPDKPLEIVWQGRRYHGQWHSDGARVHVGSAYGSHSVPLTPTGDTDPKDAAKQMLLELVKAWRV